ncbi:MAG: isocitrate lyase/PEP mutase family protein [Pseudomonadota bacterium]
MADASIKKKIEAGEFFVAPGVFDMMSVMMANRVGFECIYASGFWLTASYLGIPDAGIATYTDMLNRVSRVVELSTAPVIADADTGFGGLLNIQQTVRGYEAVGVTGIQIEDQEFPKKCGHTPYRRVVPLADMLGRIAVALDSRHSDDCLIIARTDARTGSGLDEALERGARFAEAGADLVFVEALESEDELRQAAQTVSAPLLANMADGGVTPILSAAELKEIGFAGAIFPAIASLAANAAVEAAMKHLKTTGTSQGSPVDRFDFPTFCREIGFEEVWEFEKKWAHLLESDASQD